MNMIKLMEDMEKMGPMIEEFKTRFLLLESKISEMHSYILDKKNNG